MTPTGSRILLLTPALLALACGGGPEEPRPLAAVPTTARLYYDNGGGIPDSMNLVIRDEAAWRDVWRRATSTETSAPPLPAVDFDNEMVLVVAAGPMTPEDQIRVDSVGVREVVNMNGDRERVLTALVRIIVGCGGFGGEAFPMEIVRVRDYRGEVDFQVTRTPAPGCSQDLETVQPVERGTRTTATVRGPGPPSSPWTRIGAGP